MIYFRPRTFSTGFHPSNKEITIADPDHFTVLNKVAFLCYETTYHEKNRILILTQFIEVMVTLLEHDTEYEFDRDEIASNRNHNFKKVL